MGQPFPSPLLCPCAPHPFMATELHGELGQAADPTKTRASHQSPDPALAAAALLEEVEVAVNCNWDFARRELKHFTIPKKSSRLWGQGVRGDLWGGRNKTKGRNTQREKGGKAFCGLNSLSVPPPWSAKWGVSVSCVQSAVNAPLGMN